MNTDIKIDQEAVEAFAGHMSGQHIGAVTTAMVVLGDELGLYRSMTESGPVTPEGLAAATGTYERYVREWLAQQAAIGFVHYDNDTGTFELPAEHALVLAGVESPVAMAGAALMPAGLFRRTDELADVFRTGRGLAWGDQDDAIFESAARFFGVAYRTHLVADWIPALDGVEEKLLTGAQVADVGTGQGVVPILMAEAYPESHHVGYDSHEPSIETARKGAVDAGVGDRVRFEVADATGFPTDGYDLISFCDALHDMGDPVAAAAHARKALAPGGALMLVEPLAFDDLATNLANNPGAALQYGASLVCVGNSLSQPVGLALGAQAGESRLRAVLAEAGYGSVRRVAETPFNMVLEARE